jgi:hypothetical protein
LKDWKEKSMKRTLKAGTVLVGLLSGALLAQDATPSAADPKASQPQTPSAQTQAQQGPPVTSQTNSLKIAPGSVIPVQLTKTVDAKKVKTGDEVIAKVTMDMKTGTGDVLVPKDTKIVGHITEAQARNKEQKESQLAIAFDQAYVKNQQVALPMSIQAVIGQENNDENPNNAPSGAAPTPGGTGTSASSPMAGRTPTGGAQPQAAGAPDTPGGGAQQEPGKRPAINGQTQGVIGISNLSLSQNSDSKQGSTLTSEKNNVKLESGTMLLLRVNQ